MFLSHVLTIKVSSMEYKKKIQNYILVQQTLSSIIAMPSLQVCIGLYKNGDNFFKMAIQIAG